MKWLHKLTNPSSKFVKFFQRFPNYFLSTDGRTDGRRTKLFQQASNRVENAGGETETAIKKEVKLQSI